MGVEDLDFSDITPVEQPTQGDVGEAPFLAQIGRGQLDVVEGVAQVVTNISDKVQTYEKAIDILDKPGSIGNTFAKSIVSAVIALNPDEILRKEEVSDYSRGVSEELKLYRQNNPDLQGGRILGSIATPLTLVPGYKGKGLLEKMFTGAGISAGMSATQPVENVDEFWAEKGEQALWGAATGPIVVAGGSLVSTLIGWADELTKPLYKSGVIRDVGKFLKETITENKDKIIKSINKAMKSGDKKTVGQIIAESAKETGDDFGGMLVRLEKDLARESDSLKSLYVRQSQSKRVIIDSLAGTDDEFAAAVAKRSEEGVRDYTERAFKVSVAPDNKLKALLNNKFAKKALTDAKALARAKGGASSSEVLHLTKLGLDKQISAKGDLALSKAEKDIVGQVKNRLVGWLENKNPAYAAARNNYRANSIPINKMEVGREIRNKFIGALDEDKPSVFAAGIRDAHKILKKVTGEKRLKNLDDIFNPDEVSGLKNIVKDLAIEKKATKMAAGSKSVLKELTGEVNLDLPHILSRPIVIANHVLRKLGQDKTPEYKAVINSLMMNPDEFVRIYGGSSSNLKTQYAIDVVKRLSLMVPAQQPARAKAEIGETESTDINALNFTGL